MSLLSCVDSADSKPLPEVNDKTLRLRNDAQAEQLFRCQIAMLSAQKHNLVANAPCLS